MKNEVTMEHFDLDKIIAGTCGFFGGMIMFIRVAWVDPTYWASLAKAGGTALVCGTMGVAGKYLFMWLMKKWKSFKIRK